MLRRLFGKAEKRAPLPVKAPPGEIIVYSSDDGDVMVDDQGRVTWLTGGHAEEERLTVEQQLAETADLEARISELHAANAMLQQTASRWEWAFWRAMQEVNPRRPLPLRKVLEADLIEILSGHDPIIPKHEAGAFVVRVRGGKSRHYVANTPRTSLPSAEANAHVTRSGDV
jgi:hypothetical protein